MKAKLSIIILVLLASFYLIKYIIRPFYTENVSSKSDHWKESVQKFESLKYPINSNYFIGNSIVYGLNNYKFKKPVFVQGIRGDFSSGVVKRVGFVTKNFPSKVFILIGINDLLAGKSVSETIKNIKKIVSSFSNDTEIYLVSILPISFKNGVFVNSKATSKKIIETNNSLKLIENTVYIDLHSLMKNSKGRLKPEYTYDGVHLNEKGYNCFIEKINQYL